MPPVINAASVAAIEATFSEQLVLVFHDHVETWPARITFGAYLLRKVM